MSDPSRETGPLVAVAVAALVGVVLVGVGATGVGVALVLLGVAGAVAVAVGPLARRTESLADIVVPRGAGPDAVGIATAQRRLLQQLQDPDQVDLALRPRLAALAAARLARRGVDPASAEARTLLGEPLADFTAGRRRPRPVGTRELDGWLTRLEAL